METVFIWLKRLIVAGLVLLAAFTHAAAGSGEYQILEPALNNGKKWRIGYMEGGPYENYQALLKAFAKVLMETGWITETPFPKPLNPSETQTIWDWLASDVQSGYLDFAADAYWTDDWDKKRRQINKTNAIKRLNEKRDIDLMLAFGTWAGMALANNDHSTPTMLFSASDPIRAGIIKSARDSGYDHLHARVDPDRYKRQIRLFHQIFGFKKLGIAYQDTPDGRTYAALDDLKDVARELDFKVIECFFPRQIAYSREEKNTLLECHRKLAARIDAFYLTEQTGVNRDNLHELLIPFFKHQIPTFAQRRTYEARYGVLMSLAQIDFARRAKFHGCIFSKILHGSKPRDLPQIFKDDQEIAINLMLGDISGLYEYHRQVHLSIH